MRHCLIACLLVAALLPSTHAAVEGPGGVLLGRIDTAGTVSSFPLPVCAQLEDASGGSYVLVKATAAEISDTGLACQILDSDAEVAAYVLAYEFRAGARRAARGLFNIVHDDGRALVVRSSSGDEIGRLADLGFQCRRLGPATTSPLLMHQVLGLAPAWGKTEVSSNAWVAEMMARVKQTNLYVALAELTGAQAAVAGGSYTNILTRSWNSGVPARRATELAYEHFNALGLQPMFHQWARSGFSGSNVVGVHQGTSASSEVVVVCAHIDDVPVSGNAPGADDNASGSVGVMAAAEILRQFSFERTIRFILFTGEEQGMLGSEVYAHAAQAAGDNIVAVLNLDMLGWDGNADKVMHLHARPVSALGYAGDLAIASTFTNVVQIYGLSGSLVPVILAGDSGWSDHYSFQTHGYSAICAIEDHESDSNPRYHTDGDTVDALNLPYYTSFVRAAIGTVAHLARPGQRLAFDAVKVCNGTFQTDSSVGVGTFVARHESGAADGVDSRDADWSSMAANPNAAWLKMYTEPSGSRLAIDVRPSGSETIYRGTLGAVKTGQGNFTCTNRLRFAFAGEPSDDCVYMVKVAVESNFTPNAVRFDCITNLTGLIAGGGFLNLPGLASVTNGAVYGTCEISRRFVSRDPPNLGLSQVISNRVALSIPCQPGAVVADAIEYATNLTVSGQWAPLAVFTNSPIPDAASFESGWTNVCMTVNTSALSNAPAGYFRLKRQWFEN